MDAVEICEHEVLVSGHPVHYRVAGTGYPVILVHGLSGSTRWWRRNIPALAQRYRVHLVDLPGFGTMRRHRRRFVLAEADSWLLAWMEAVGLGQAHLVGHSMGGYICLRFAAHTPQKVGRLVLVAPAGIPTGRSPLDHIVSLLHALRYTTPSFLPLLAQDLLRAGPWTLWRAARDLLTEDVQEHLQSITAPTLLLWGENDTLIPPALGSLLREQIADSRLLILKGAGHVPMFDRPQEFDDALLAFLEGEPVGE